MEPLAGVMKNTRGVRVRRSGRSGDFNHEPPDASISLLKLSGMQTKNDHHEKTELEIIQERAEVLGRTGEALHRAIQEMKAIEERIDLALASACPDEASWRAINREIKKFNKAREHAKLRYYYLIVTREAMGFRRHKSVEETYRIPPRKKPLMRMEWTGTKSRE